MLLQVKTNGAMAEVPQPSREKRWQKKKQTKPLKENKCRFTKVFLIKWETRFNSLHICSFECKSAQYKSVPLELFCRWEKPYLQELPDQSIHSLAICWATNSHAKARRAGPWAWGGTHEHIQAPQPSSSPCTTPPHLKMHPLLPAPGAFRTFLQNEALHHKMFRTHHTTFPPIGPLKEKNIKWF